MENIMRNSLSQESVIVMGLFFAATFILFQLLVLAGGNEVAVTARSLAGCGFISCLLVEFFRN